MVRGRHGSSMASGSRGERSATLEQTGRSGREGFQQEGEVVEEADPARIRRAATRTNGGHGDLLYEQRERAQRGTIRPGLVMVKVLDGEDKTRSG